MYTHIRCTSIHKSCVLYPTTKVCSQFSLLLHYEKYGPCCISSPARSNIYERPKRDEEKQRKIKTENIYIAQQVKVHHRTSGKDDWMGDVAAGFLD